MAGYGGESSEGQGGRVSDQSWRQELSRQYIPEAQPTQRTPVYMPHSAQPNVAFYESVDEEAPAGGIAGDVHPGGGGGGGGASRFRHNRAPGDWSSSSDSVISVIHDSEGQIPGLPPPRSLSLQRRSTNRQSSTSFTSTSTSSTGSEFNSDEDDELIYTGRQNDGGGSLSQVTGGDEERPFSTTPDPAPSTLSSNPTILVAPVNIYQKKAMAAKSAQQQQLQQNQQQQQHMPYQQPNHHYPSQLPPHQSTYQPQYYVNPQYAPPTQSSPHYNNPYLDTHYADGTNRSTLHTVPEDHLMSFSFATDDGKITATELRKFKFKQDEQFLDSSSLGSSDLEEDSEEDDTTIVSGRTQRSNSRSDGTFRSVGVSHLNQRFGNANGGPPGGSQYDRASLARSDSIATSAISELLEFDEVSEVGDDVAGKLDRLGMIGMEKEEESFQLTRERDPDCYFEDGKTVIDFVLVYESKIKHATKSEMKAENRRRMYRLAFERKLEDIGLRLEHQVPEQSNIKDTAVIKVHATWEFLTKLADMTGMRSPLAPNDMESSGSCTQVIMDCINSVFTCFVIPKSYQIPFKDYFYAKFEKKFENAYHIDSKKTFFTTIQRMKLVSYAIERVTINRIKKHKNLFRRGRKKGKRGKDANVVGSLTIGDLCSKGIYKAWYPLHDSGLSMEPYKTLMPDRLPLRLWLYEYWARYKRCFTFQPLDEIREYFGEEIAMYFAWLGFYTQMLIIPTLLSIFCFGYGLHNSSMSSVVRELCEGSGGHEVANSSSLVDSTQLHLDGDRKMCRSCPNPTCPYKELSAECTNARIATVFDNEMTSVYAIFMSLWTICFLEMWKRKRSYLSFRWDTFTRDNQQALLRPQYKMKVTNTALNPATQKVEIRMKTKEKLTRLLISFSFCAAFIFMVICVLVGIQVYKLTSSAVYYRLQNPLINKVGASTVASISGSIMNAVFIAITNMMWSRLAWKMTEYETPKTQSQFEKSYIYKVVLFQFINFYGLLLYMTLLKGKLFTTPDKQTMSIEQCPAAGCLPEIIIQLIIIMTGKQILNNILEISLPLIKNFMRRRGLTRKKPKNDDEEPEDAKVRWEEDLGLAPMTLPVAFGDYLEMIIQYGFMTMFAAAFPPAALFALINNMLEIRLDGQKYLAQDQRIRPRSARNIGPWKTILDVVTRIAIVVNAITLAFTTQFVDRLVYRLMPITRKVINTCIGEIIDKAAGNLDRTHLEGYLDWRMTAFNTSMYSVLYEEPTNDTDDNPSFFSKASSFLLSKTNLEDKVGNFTGKLHGLKDTFGLNSEELTADSFLDKMRSSTNPTTNNQTIVETCYFIGLYRLDNEGEGYQQCADFWYVLVAKLAFVVLFEHLVVLCQTIIGMLIPDVPSEVEEHVLREKFLQNELFIRHEQEMQEKAAKAALHRKMYPHLAKAARGYTGQKEVPIRLRGPKSKRHKAKKMASGGGKKKPPTSGLGSLANLFHRSNNKVDVEDSPEPKRTAIEEPEVRKIRPAGYQERAKSKRKRNKPLLIQLFQKMNYYC